MTRRRSGVRVPHRPPMRDRLLFTAVRRNGRLVVVVDGQDHNGDSVGFELDPKKLEQNLSNQIHWAMRVNDLSALHQGMIEAGIDPEVTWTVVQGLLPPPLRSVTH